MKFMDQPQDSLIDFSSVSSHEKEMLLLGSGSKCVTTSCHCLHGASLNSEPFDPEVE